MTRMDAYRIEVSTESNARRFLVTGPDGTCRDYRLPEASHPAYLDWHAALARDFGTRPPLNRRPAMPPTGSARFQALIVDNLSPRILYGYGDPALLKVEDGYRAVVTSNDAPDAFPILRARQLEHWEPAGFVFPRGHTPAWALSGAEGGDFWAPELHRFPDEFRVCFCARQRAGGDFAIGLARAAAPDGPFTPDPAPLLTGNVIDPHLLVRSADEAYLFWKEDANDHWPRRLAALLGAEPERVNELFLTEEDRRTARLAAALQPWAEACAPMERFFTLQTLIETVTADWAGFRRRLAQARDAVEAATAEAIDDILGAMSTPIFGQRLSPDGHALVGERRVVLRNDQDWEAHLVEGVWVSEHAGRFYLFHAGNDFSTADYGIGVAVADAPLGPYHKHPGPLLTSTPDWAGPGHPSVAPGPNGQPLLFLHAFFPGAAGYKRFRALLALPIAFEPDGVRLR